MKNTLLIPIKYLLIYLCVGLLLTTVLYIHSWISNIALQAELSWHVTALLRSAYSAQLPTSVISLVILILFVQRRRGKPLILFIMIWICFSGLYLVMLNLLSPYSPLTSADSLPVEIPQRIHTYTDGSVYVEQDFSPGSAAVILRPKESPHMTGGAIDTASAQELSMQGVSLKREPQNPFFNTALNPAGILKGIFRDFRVVESAFAYLSSASPSRLTMTIAAFGLMMTAGWIFGRFTSWPLLNTVYLLFMVRIALLFLAVLLHPEVEDLVASFFPGTDMMNLLPYLFCGVGGLLIVWDLLFVPFYRESPGAKSV